jgi:hypothetical protein
MNIYIWITIIILIVFIMLNSKQLTEKMTSELIEYPNTYLYGKDLATYSSLSKDPELLKSQCFTKCVDNNNDPIYTTKCVGFSTDPKSGKCWIKYKLENKLSTRHINSYIIGPELLEYPKTNYDKNDINTFNLTSSDPNVLKTECLAKCINHNNDPKNTRKCIGFSTDISTKKCMIKNKLEKKASDPNVNSYKIGPEITEYQKTTYSGNDIKEYKLNTNPEELKLDCLANCVKYNNDMNNDTKCVGFVIEPQTGKCWLKSKLEKKAIDNKRISYSIDPELVEYKNTNFPKNDLHNYTLSKDPEELKSQCLAKFIDYNNDPKNTIKGAGFAIHPTSGKCWIKSKLENKTTTDGVHNYKVLMLA